MEPAASCSPPVDFRWNKPRSKKPGASPGFSFWERRTPVRLTVGSWRAAGGDGNGYPNARRGSLPRLHVPEKSRTGVRRSQGCRFFRSGPVSIFVPGEGSRNRKPPSPTLWVCWERRTPVRLTVGAWRVAGGDGNGYPNARRGSLPRLYVPEKSRTGVRRSQGSGF